MDGLAADDEDLGLAENAPGCTNRMVELGACHDAASRQRELAVDPCSFVRLQHACEWRHLPQVTRTQAWVEHGGDDRFDGATQYVVPLVEQICGLWIAGSHEGQVLLRMVECFDRVGHEAIGDGTVERLAASILSGHGGGEYHNYFEADRTCHARQCPEAGALSSGFVCGDRRL